MEVNRNAPPVIKCLVNANLPGELYEQMATTGGSIKMGGTTVIQVASKQQFKATIQLKQNRGCLFSWKKLCWVVLFRLPFQHPIPIAEDKQCHNTTDRAHGKNNAQRLSCGHKDSWTSGSNIQNGIAV
jgi:hypothetical protein